MTKNAVAVRDFSVAGAHVPAGKVLLEMAPNQFADFEMIAFVRELRK